MSTRSSPRRSRLASSDLSAPSRLKSNTVSECGASTKITASAPGRSTMSRPTFVETANASSKSRSAPCSPLSGLVAVPRGGVDVPQAGLERAVHHGASLPIVDVALEPAEGRRAEPMTLTSTALCPSRRRPTAGWRGVRMNLYPFPQAS